MRCAAMAAPAACRCSGGDGDAPGTDPCGPSGCCCARDRAPVAPERPQPSTPPAGPGAHDSLAAPVPVPATVPDAAAGVTSFATAPNALAAAAPSLFLVCCTFRC